MSREDKSGSIDSESSLEQENRSINASIKDDRSREKEPLLSISTFLTPNNQPPPDTWMVALVIFFILGIAMLLPWNVFITATSFFELKFAGSVVFDNFESFFSIAYNTTNLLTLVAMVKMAQFMSVTSRIYFSLFPTLIVFIVVTALVKVPIDAMDFFGITMLFVIICGLTAGLLGNGVFSLSAKFPFEYTAAAMNGQGLAGTAVALSQIFTTLVATEGDPSEDSIELSALLYFLVAVIVLVVSIMAFLTLVKLPIFKYYNGRENDVDRLERNGLKPANEYVDNSWAAQLIVLKKIWKSAYSVCYNFTVTLAIFPTIIASIAPVTEDSSSRIFKDLFVPFAFLLFNVGDLIGRVTAGKTPLPHVNWICLLSTLRSIFFFLFLCSNVILRDPNGDIIENSLPLLFPNDYVYWTFVMLFSISNGYVASASMIVGPRLVDDLEKEKAGSWMIFFLVLGLTIGSFASFGLRSILCQCNPFSS